MTAATVHDIDVVVAFVIVISWAVLLILLENVADRRVLWARALSFAPLDQGFQHLPAQRGTLHVVFFVAMFLWLGATFGPSRVSRTALVVATAACLVFLITAWALR